MKQIKIIAMAFLLPFVQLSAQSKQAGSAQTDSTDKYTFQMSEKVTRQKVSFKNRFGITLSGDLYLPKNSGKEPLPALAISGPFGAVKEQSSGLYANQMAEVAANREILRRQILTPKISVPL